MDGANIQQGIAAFIIRRGETWISDVEPPREWSGDRYLLNCLAGVAFHSSAYVIWFACDLEEGLSAFEQLWTLLTPPGSHSCMSGPYVGPVLFFYLPHRPRRLLLQQAIWLHQTRPVCNIQRNEKDNVAVSIVCFKREDDEAVGIEWSHVVQKRIIKTKQRWHIWNLRTLPGRNEVYQSQAVSGRNGSLLPGVPLWVRWAGQKIEILKGFFFIPFSTVGVKGWYMQNTLPSTSRGRIFST